MSDADPPHPDPGGTRDGDDGSGRPYDGPASAGPAARKVERILAVGAAVSRVGALPLLISGLVAAMRGSPPAQARWVLIVMSAGLTVESVVLVVAWLRAGVVRPGWAATDVACIAAVLASTGTGVATGAAPGESAFYNFAVIAVVAFGLARWRLCAAVAAGVAAAVASMSPVLLPAAGHDGVRQTVSASVTFLGSAVLVWLIAALVRRAARGVDLHAATAVQLAGELAVERVRAHYTQALSARVLATMDALLTAPDVLDPALREHVQAEARWLRDLLDGGMSDGTELLTALRVLASDKARDGLRVVLELPDQEPSLTPEQVAGLAGAVREALTNVVRHAGVAAAEVRVTDTGSDVVVEVTDRGRGYDEGGHDPGTGQRGSIRQRLADLGGVAEIRSAPGAGTRVMVRLPVAHPVGGGIRW